MTDVHHCRLCAEMKSTSDLIEINKNPATFNLDFKIYQCFQIQIEGDDKLPKSVCSTCCDQVIRMHEFSEKIHQAQDVLKRIYIHLEDFKDDKDNWQYSHIDESTNNIENLVKVEQKEDDFDDADFETNDVKNESFSDVKDEIALDKLVVGPLEVKRESKPKNKKHKRQLKQWENYIWQCQDCPTDYKSVEEFREHYKNEHKKPAVYFCADCSKSYSKYLAFRQHIRNHINKHKYRCDVCGKYFCKRYILTDHRLTHSDVRKYKCDTCGDCFKSRTGLQTHTRLHLPEEQQRFYECDVCQKKCNSYSQLVSHKQIHIDSVNAKAVCEQCGKAFIARKLLEAHMKIHVIGKPYSCDQCNKTFKVYTGLYKHKKSAHSKITFSCDICDRKLKSKYLLNNHKLTHSSNYPHVCSYCNKGFKIKQGLTIHLRQHTGESPFACLECKHYFTNDSNFIKHLKGRHKLKNVSIVNNHQYPFINPIAQQST